MHTDYFGKSADCLKGKKLFLLDMDGTIYEGDRLFDGTLEFLRAVKNIGGEYFFITNNSSKSVADYVKKVSRMGIPADKNNFFTSAQASILYLKENHPGKCVYCQGTASLVQELRDAGLDVVSEYSDRAEVILVGYDTELTTQKIHDTCRMLKRDLPYIATNPDYVCPVSFGFVPDCGSLCMMYEKATGRTPLFIGKPEPAMIDIMRRQRGRSKEETVVVGDRLYTDIAGGYRAGVDTICVLSGEATVDAIKAYHIKPTFTFPSVTEIAELLGDQV